MGASDQYDKTYVDSNYGACVSIFAPVSVHAYVLTLIDEILTLGNEV